jgi:hypothetical protein
LEEVVLEYKNLIKYNSGFNGFLQDCAYMEGIVTGLSKKFKVEKPYSFLNVFDKNGIKKEFKDNYFKGLNKVKYEKK